MTVGVGVRVGDAGVDIRVAVGTGVLPAVVGLRPSISVSLFGSVSRLTVFEGVGVACGVATVVVPASGDDCGPAWQAANIGKDRSRSKK